MIRRIVVVVLLSTPLVACGGGGGEGKTSKPDDSLPKCSDVWVDGKTIPKGYEGCENGDTTEVGVSTPCKTGAIYTYEPTGGGFFTTPAGKIVEAGEDYANDPRYAKANDDC